ncbi:hypothetical protein [Aliivibrio fischeri]|uniref:hypothetical protein n=1 Tax=Aliivibrio fischeri TaxID=668 RepID=UPI0007C4B174|nr:hypothetical protein [Aliivibrio fischeri]
MTLSLHQWYPPSRFVFMPLYRKLRRKFGCKRKAMVGVMPFSWSAHVALLGLLEINKPLMQSYGTIWSFFVFGGLTLYAAFGDIES